MGAPPKTAHTQENLAALALKFGSVWVGWWVGLRLLGGCWVSGLTQPITTHSKITNEQPALNHGHHMRSLRAQLASPSPSKSIAVLEPQPHTFSKQFLYQCLEQPCTSLILLSSSHVRLTTPSVRTSLSARAGIHQWSACHTLA